MKFIIDSEDLKRTSQRAMAVCNPKSDVKAYHAIEMVASDDGVFMLAYCETAEVSIKTEGHTIENGKAFILASDLKKILNMRGDLTVEKIEDRLRVKSDKKSCEVPLCKLSRIPSMLSDVEKLDHIFDGDAHAFLSMMERTADAVAVNDAHGRIYMGFHIDGEHGKLIACDAYRVHIVDLDVTNKNEKALAHFHESFCAEGFSHLRKLIDKRVKCPSLGFFHHKNYLAIYGEDFEYYVRYIFGEFPNVLKLLPREKEYEFRLNVGELLAIAKEYNRASDQHTMYMLSHGKDMRTYTVTESGDYKTADKLEHFEQIRNSREEFMMGMNTRYLVSALESMDCKEVTVYGEYSWRVKETICTTKAMILSGNGLTALLCPLNPGGKRGGEVEMHLAKSFMMAL